MNNIIKEPTVGIDVGGSSIKMGTVIDGEVFQYKTFELPVSSTPNNVFAYIRSNLPADCSDTIGIAMPCVVQNGYMKTTANIDDSWQTINAELVGNQMLEKRCVFINDCDAAALAEVNYGAARHIDGTVIVLTLGTGIGTALFHNGTLFPNTELGHIGLFGITSDAERYASAKVKTNLELDWHTYTDRVNVYLNELHRLFWPSAFIIGGGVSENFNKWQKYINVPCDVYKAELGNDAGIVGAALYAKQVS
jgi:polyphosphate glucokinase